MCHFVSDSSLDVGRQLVHPRQRGQQNGIGFGFGAEQFAGDFVISRGQVNTVTALIAGFGVVGLNNRLNQNYVGIGDGLFHVLRFLEVQAVLF